MKKFDFHMTAGEYFVKRLLLVIFIMLSYFTLLIAVPWIMVWYYRWYYDHVTLEGKKLNYTATGKELFKEMIIIFLLQLVTLGIYSFWAYPRIEKFN